MKKECVGQPPLGYNKCIPDRRMTNGDRIRQITDEELAESLFGSVACKHVTSCFDTSCYECTLKRLKQEVKEDGQS